MGEFRKAYRRAFFAFARAFVIFFCGVSLAFSAAAAMDLTFGIGWGWTWPAIPGGIGFALFGLAFYWVIGRMDAFMARYFEPFRPGLLRADLERMRQPRR